MPVTSHCEIALSSLGKRYDGKKSIKNDTSCAVPAERILSVFGSRFPVRTDRPELTLDRVHIDPVW